MPRLLVVDDERNLRLVVEKEMTRQGHEVACAEDGEAAWVLLESQDFDLPRDYDAAVLLHVLEHLFEPDVALQKVARRIRPGGVLIGGSPVLPHFLVASHQKLERKTAQPMGHVSVFSPPRVIEMAEAAGCTTEFISGAFFMRSSGSSLENSAAWLRFNLWWGSRFPSWPGEIYWLMRKR